MITLPDCARYLVWPRHHGQQKSTIALPACRRAQPDRGQPGGGL